MVTLPIYRGPRPASAFAHTGSLTLCVTHNCNLDCSHCSVEAADARSVKVMPLEVVEQTLKTVVAPSINREIGVVFFGGEPLLAPLSWYQDTLTLFARQASHQFRYGIQTNGTILSEKHIAFFREHDIQLSVSLDGPPSLNDVFRQRGQRVLDNLARLQDADIAFGVICLVSPHSWNRIPELLDYFASHGFYKLRFNTCFSVGRGRDMQFLTQEQLFTAKRAILDRMLDSQGRGIVDRNMAEQVQWFARSLTPRSLDERHGCAGFYCHAGRSYFSIDPKGDIYPCSDITFTRPDLHMGSVFDTWDVARWQRANRINEAFHMKGIWWADCASCDASKICDYGCPAFIVRGDENVNLECGATKMMWRYMNQRRDDVVALARQLHRPDSAESRRRQIATAIRDAIVSVEAAGNADSRVERISADEIVVAIDDVQYTYNRGTKTIAVTDSDASP